MHENSGCSCYHGNGMRIYLVFPFGNNFGWGICGQYVAYYLNQLTPVTWMSDQFDAAYLDMPEWGPSLEPILMDRATCQQMLDAKAVRIQAPVITGMSSINMSPMSLELKGSPTIGYTFFETMRFDPKCMAKAAHYYDVITAGSAWCCEILALYGLQAVPVIQGVNMHLFHPNAAPQSKNPDTFTVFSGGKFEFRKGQDIVIRALAIFMARYPDVHFVASWFNPWPASMATMAQCPYIQYKDKGNFQDTIRALLSEWKLPLERVTLLDAVPHSFMPGIMANTDIGLFPNRCEGGTNLVLMEYMAMGKPAIAADLTGHRDILTAENSVRILSTEPESLPFYDQQQWVADWQSPNLDEILAHLEWAYHHRDALHDIGQQAATDMATWSWQKTARDFLNLIPS